MAFNDKYLIMAWNDNPGYINMVNLSEPFNKDIEKNIFSVERSYILDMEFSPLILMFFILAMKIKKFMLHK